MATKNIKEAEDYDETGWFYHAPARRQHVEPVLYPPMSQIPGLAEDDGIPEDPVRPLFRDTDTKYIRLAKQGGRANLLQMKENAPKKEPVGYPRNEWYYLEDNTIEDAQGKPANDLEYEFSRPEYMVHEPYRREVDATYERPGRGPLGYDKMSVFERDGDGRATDKTVKLPNLLHPGYGIRSGKPLRIPKNLQAEKKPPSAQTDPGRGPRPLRYLAMPGSGNPKDRPKMNKILSYAYEKEWQDNLTDWQTKQDIGRDRHKTLTNIPPYQDEKVQSEYSMTYNKRSVAVHSAQQREKEPDSARISEGKSMKTVRQTETQRLREAKLKKPEEKDLFKMTRFKNIPARIETHRQGPPRSHVAAF